MSGVWGVRTKGINMADWSFGTTQLLTTIGMIATGSFAVAGLRTFGKWKKEKIEERRIEVALDALTLAYESKHVFDAIRRSLSYDVEYKDMPVKEGESENDRAQRGSFWVVGSRVRQNRDFFDRAWKLQPRVMAMFGEQVETTFAKLHSARATIQVASNTLTWEMPLHAPRPSKDDFELRKQFRSDLWGGGKDDRVQADLDEFRAGIVRLCRPVVDREFRVKPPT